MIVKKKIIYEEEIYCPDYFGISERRIGAWLATRKGLPVHVSMPALLIGWTRSEVHLQFHYQGLQ